MSNVATSPSTPVRTAATQFFTFGQQEEDALRLRGGDILGPVTLAYEAYGELSPSRDNTILLFHALTGSQHAAGFNPAVEPAGELWTDECKTGWWDGFIGPGKALDTTRYFVLCVNYIGGCYGSTGPHSINPRTGRPYGGAFPRITIGDIADSQLRLLEHLGIHSLAAVIGGSIGGMLAINLAVRFPQRVRTVIPIASSLTVSLLQRVHNFEQIFAIEEDANFRGGDYYGARHPEKGLALARMIGHKTFVSLQTIETRARDEIVRPSSEFQRYQLTHNVESYFLHQGKKFVRRFDANSYLRIVEAWQRFDLLAETGAPDFVTLFQNCRHQNYLVFSIDSDVCYYPEEQREMVNVLRKARVPCHYVTVHSEKGHDSFLLEPTLYAPHIREVLK